MLVLSRTQGQSIVIGDEILVTVELFNPDRVKLRIARTIPNARISFEDLVNEVWLARDETVNVGPDITCMIVQIDQNKVRLGIDLPRTVAIHRKEVYDKIHGLD